MTTGSPRALFEAAYARHQAGDLAGAQALYRQVLAAAPGHADSLHLLGLACAQSGRLEEAVELMGKAVAARPDFDLAWYNLGNTLRRLGRLDAAGHAYHQALRLKPDAPQVLLNLGVTLRDLGRPAEAIDAYRRAIAARPGYAEAHYNLGCALQALGQDAEAVQAFTHALAADPGHADALANLAGVLLALGRQGQAVAACQKRIALEPDSAEAHTALAAALLAQGRVDEAVAAGQRAARLRPDDPNARMHLGNALREQGAMTAAVDAYRRAVQLDPGHAGAWVNLGIGLQEAGDAAGAAEAIERALALDPRSAAAWSVRGGLKTFTADDPDIAVLSGLLDTAGAAEDRIHLEFTLGKAFMDTGEAGRAFAHLDAGNRLHRARLTYDVAGDVAQFAQIARSLDAAALARLAGTGASSEAPVFIVGMPRSGTTLVEQILASHPHVFGGGEMTRLEQILIGRLGAGLPPIERARRLGELTAADLHAMGSLYADGVSALTPGYLRVTDKMPSNFRLAGLIHLILPNARIVHCRRDPVDTCLSGYMRKFSHGQDFTYDLGDLGAYYRAYEGLMTHWRTCLPGERFLEVAYEDVVADLEGQARRLVAFCGLDWHDNCLAFHKTERQVRTASVNQVRQPLYRTSVARWKAYEPYLGPLLDVLHAGIES